jgi:hypothetical protein
MLDTPKIEYLAAPKISTIKQEPVVGAQVEMELLYLPNAYPLQLEQILVAVLDLPPLVVG